MKKIKSCMLIIALYFTGIVFSGCSSVSLFNKVDSTGVGSYVLSVSWPGVAGGGKDGSRYIPEDAQTIYVSITGVGINPTEPVTTSIIRPQTALTSTITFSNLPAGAKVALIKALDLSSNVLVQRKESFIIYNGRTSISENIPLGIAIKMSGTNIVFEPSIITVTPGTNLPFQNWTTSSVTITGINANLPLSAAHQDAAQRWFFNEGTKNITETTIGGMQGRNPTVTIIIPDPDEIVWQKCAGGFFSDVAVSVRPTGDGGYMAGGYTKSIDGDVSGHHGYFYSYDYWLVRLSSNGSVMSQHCFGGYNNDQATAMEQTADGGYIFAGWTTSNDGDVSGNHGGADWWIVKINGISDITWQKCYGGSSHDYAQSIWQTTDGGYIVAGYTYSNDGDVVGIHETTKGDFWVVKLNAAGGLVWQRCLGGTKEDWAYSAIQTADGCYVIAGKTTSNNGDVFGHHNPNNYDCWVVKLDANGGLIWQKCLGGNNDDEAKSLWPTSDGGFILGGSTNSTDGDVSGQHYPNYSDMWVAKLNSTCGLEWQRCLGGTYPDAAQSIQQTTDGGYIVAGFTMSNDGDVTGNHSILVKDFWIVKLTPTGVMEWQKCCGGTSTDSANSIRQDADGGYIVGGFTRSNDGDVSSHHNPDSDDFWVVKLRPM